MARTGVFGRSGAGKSWWFGWYLERVIPEFEYAIHFDIEDEEQGLSKKGESLLKTFYVDQEFFNERRKVDGRTMPLVHAVTLKNKKVRIVPDSLTPHERQELFAQICGLAMELGKTDATVHVSSDEAHEVVPDKGEDLDQRIVRMLTGGRKKGVEWALCTQRPAKLHSDAFTQLNYGVYFQMTKDNDVMKVNNSTNFDAFHRLKDLEERECIIENLDTGTDKTVNTDSLSRNREHVGGDDGLADDVLDGVEGD